jgi:hypothetical protein
MLHRYVLAGLVVIASSVAFAQGPRQDGKWEITTEVDMPGMPMKMPARTTTQCVTKEDAADPAKAILKQSDPQGGRGNPDCKISDLKTNGNSVTWTMKCEGRDAMTGSGQTTYSPDSYTGTMTINRAGQTMTMKYSGKRLGDCTK